MKSRPSGPNLSAKGLRTPPVKSAPTDSTMTASASIGGPISAAASAHRYPKHRHGFAGQTRTEPRESRACVERFEPTQRDLVAGAFAVGLEMIASINSRCRARSACGRPGRADCAAPRSRRTARAPAPGRYQPARPCSRAPGYYDRFSRGNPVAVGSSLACRGLSS